MYCALLVSGLMIPEVMPLSTQTKTPSFLQKLLAFFDNTSHFRLVFMAVMFLDIRYLSGIAYSIVLSVMFVWSLWLIIDRMILRKGILRLRYRSVIYVFLMFALFTIILHAESNLLQNLITLYWMVVCFFLFYGIHAEKSNVRVKKEMRRSFEIINAVTTAIMLVSLVLFAIFPNGFKLMGFEFCIIEKRFVGVIPNANVTAFYSVIAIVACTFLLRMRRADGTLTGKLRIWYAACIVINAFTLILTDSNASLLLMMVFLSFLAFYELFKEFTFKKFATILFRLVALSLACVTIVSSLFFIRVGVQKGVSAVLTTRSSNIAVSTGLNANDGDIELEDEPKKSPAISSKPALGHQNKNIDSGRYVLWRQALGLLEKYPVFGIGSDNIADYGEFYLGGVRYTDIGGNHYVNFHNGLLTIAVSFGLVGLSLFLTLAVTIAKAILKAVFLYKNRSRRDGNMLVMIAAFSAACCVYSMFEVALFVDYTYRVFIFWMIIGLGLSYVFKYRHQAALDGRNDINRQDDTSEWDYLKNKFSSLRSKGKTSIEKKLLHSSDSSLTGG